MISVAVTEQSQVGQAQRRALEMGRRAGLQGEVLDRLALVATEIATNLARHAVDGELLVGPTEGHEPRGCRVIGVDTGPGVPSIDKALEDGFTTATRDRGIGGGLGAIRRMSDCFDIHSDAQGTTVVAGVAPGLKDDPPPLVAGLTVPMPGTEAGGDAWAMRRGRDSTLVALFDVLGHGPNAAEVAETAVDAFLSDEHRGLEAVDAALSRALTSSRGAALVLVEVPHGEGPLRATGVGNIRGEVVSGASRKGIVSAAGIAGQMSRGKAVLDYEWGPGAALILSTDGLRDRPGEPFPPGLLYRSPLVVAATLYRRRRRGTDDSGIVVVRAG